MIVLYTLGLMNLCWIYFLAIMHLRDAKDAGRITKAVMPLGYFNLLIGLILDVAVNVLVMSVLLLEFPHELLTTARLNRHIKSGSGWRKAIALWFCHNMLSTFDSTQRHCGE
ncbi:MAG: hypothetical protein KGK17_04820 [Betaproteobacteria bacterium]|nr:hypothetical protein [Betaproteobacteria bacterium]